MGQPRRQNAVTLGCLAVMAFLYSAAVFNVVVPHLGYSVHGASHLLLLTALTGLAAATYLQCVYCDPGKVPADWQPDIEQQTAAGVLQVKRRGGGNRFCKKCRAFKPPRTHHCRRCGHCVRRMDHHCVWVNNCIGHGNYRAFLLMCCYLAAACLHALGLLLQLDAHLVQVALGWDEESRVQAAAGGASHRLAGSGGGGAAGAEEAAGAAELAGGGGIVASKVGWMGPLWLHAVVQTLATAVALPVSVGLVVLLVWNMLLLLRNQTTIEYHEGVVARFMAPGAFDTHSSSGGRHPFDLGWEGNVQHVCGSSPACWPVPGRAAACGDGMHFPSPFAAPPQQQLRGKALASPNLLQHSL
ncbi:hypothetical protein D9Q98_009485 [Chlorella vulgaris]|uniref:S-acyltransferase n=1 Tax=Chlorella vulgaris TaxID=3077 RepID=A0A9D4TFB6_CHLVU|nr:hypothetical protein D9Q98_009485 [Chlorella vulgaris]